MTLNSRTVTTADVSTYFLHTALWPAVVYTFLLMLTGIIGNVLVLLVYRRQFLRSVTRMFIFTLAALDLGSCLITMPSELLILFRFASFPSAGWCKASRYLTYTFNGSSSIILIVIALDRFYKVCRPYSTCITIPLAKKICVAGILVTAILSLPSIFLYSGVNFPILVMDGRAEILPRDLKNATWMPQEWHINKGKIKVGDAVLAPSRIGASGKFIYSVPPVAVRQVQGAPLTLDDSYADTNSDRTTNHNTPRQPDAQGSVLNGEFCLISSEDSASPLAILFYGYMFLSWLLLLILGIYFYSRVAHAMFLLSSIHDKMFSLSERARDGDGEGHSKSASRRSCTPRTASLAQENDRYEYNVQYHHQIGIKMKDQQLPVEGIVLLSHEVLKEEGKQNGGNYFQEEEDEAVSTNAEMQTNNEEQSEVERDEKCPVEATRDDDTGVPLNENESITHNLSQNTVNSAGSKNVEAVKQEESTTRQNVQVSADSVYETGSLETSSCLNLPHNNKDSQGVQAHPVASPRSKSMEEFSQNNSEGNISVGTKRKSFKLRKLSSKKRNGKIPKIRVSQTKEKSKSNDVVSEGRENRNSSLHPATTNNLLHRRIKSMENVNSISKLDCLQVPEKRKHHSSVGAKNLPERVMQKQSEDSVRKPKETTAEIGKLTNSSTSLQYTTSAAGSDDACDATLNAEKTLTLTRSSVKGKRNVCVIPLTGLTTKAALQNQENEEKKQAQARLKASTLPNSITAKIGGAFNTGRRASGMDTLENPPFEENVKLRPKSIFSRSSMSKKYEMESVHGKRASTPQAAKTNEMSSRRARPSTADILSERHRRGTLHPARTSRMLFVISMVFLVSFLPFFVIVLMRSAIGSSSFLASLSKAELGAVSIFIRSSLISNAVNPVIYGLLSTHFRRECTGLFRCLVG